MRIVNFTLILTGLFLFVGISATEENDSMEKLIVKDVASVVEGQFSPDHLGPKVYNQVKESIINNARLANYIAERKYVSCNNPVKLSNVNLVGLLNLTVKSDPEGVSVVVRKLKVIFSNSLMIYNMVKDKPALYKIVNESDASTIQRISRINKSLDEVIALLGDSYTVTELSYKKDMSGDEFVYIAARGDKYHKKECSVLKRSKIMAISLGEAKKGFNPCKRCLK